MSATDTLCFSDSDAGVGGVPTIDGFFDHDFMASGEAGEAGYINGCRMTFGGAGIAPVIFQGVRDAGADRLVLAFLCRFDPSFDANDVIVLALKPTPASAEARMIHIFPNKTGIGAATGVGTGPNQIKTGVALTPSQIACFKSTNGGASWASINDIAAVTIKVRSWKPGRPAGALPPGQVPTDECAWSVEVSIPRTAGGNPDWLDLADTFGLYFNAVRVNAVTGAVQAKFPEAAPNLTGALGVTTSIETYGNGLQRAAVGSDLAKGVRFVNGWQGVGVRPVGNTGAPGSLIVGNTAAAGTPDNELVAIIENTSAADPAADITAEFRFANWGLNNVTNFEAWAQPLGVAANPAPRRIGASPEPQVDAPVGGADVTITTKWPRAAVPNEYTVHPHQCIWVQLSAATAVNFVQSSVRRNMDFISLSDFDRPAEVSGVGYPPPPGGAAEYDFVISTYCRTINVAELVKSGSFDPETVAVVGEALQRGGDGHTGVADIRRSLAANNQSWANSVVYVWVAEGHRRTGTFLTVNDATYEVLDIDPGNFGFVAHHIGVGDNFSWSLNGPGLTQYPNGQFGLKVPRGGAAAIDVKLSASPGGAIGNVSQLPPAKGGSDGGTPPAGGGTPGLPGNDWRKWPLWLWVIIGLLLLIALLLWRCCRRDPPCKCGRPKCGCG